MNKTNHTRNVKINPTDAANILNDLIGDLVAGTNIFMDYHKRYVLNEFQIEQMAAVQRMCFSYLALSLCKLMDFWKHYNSLVPDPYRDDLKRLNTIIEKRGVRDFRNKIAGHILDEKLKRPLLNSEINVQIEKLIGNDVDGFIYWINNPIDNTYPNTIVSIVEIIRDAITKKYALSPSKIINR